MSPLPHFWRPACPQCRDVATSRLAIGDERGPTLAGVGALECETCGHYLEAADILDWQPVPVTEPAANFGLHNPASATLPRPVVAPAPRAAPDDNPSATTGRP